MKKFQQNKVAMKIALSFMLGSALFLGACSDGGDTELRNSSYYDTLEKAKNKLDWCSKKLNISFDYKKVEELLEKSSGSIMEAEGVLLDQIDEANRKGDKNILDNINRKNCMNAVGDYVQKYFVANKKSGN